MSVLLIPIENTICRDEQWWYCEIKIMESTIQKLKSLTSKSKDTFFRIAPKDVLCFVISTKINWSLLSYATNVILLLLQLCIMTIFSDYIAFLFIHSINIKWNNFDKFFCSNKCLWLWLWFYIKWNIKKLWSVEKS